MWNGNCRAQHFMMELYKGWIHATNLLRPVLCTMLEVSPTCVNHRNCCVQHSRKRMMDQYKGWTHAANLLRPVLVQCWRFVQHVSTTETVVCNNLSRIMDQYKGWTHVANLLRPILHLMFAVCSSCVHPRNSCTQHS